MQTPSKKEHPFLKIVLIIVVAAILCSFALNRLRRTSFAKEFTAGFILHDYSFTSAYRYVSDSGDEYYCLFGSDPNLVCFVPSTVDYASLSLYYGSDFVDGAFADFYYPKQTDSLEFWYASTTDDSIMVVTVIVDQTSYEPLLFDKVDIALAERALYSKKHVYLLNRED